MAPSRFPFPPLCPLLSLLPLNVLNWDLGYIWSCAPNLNVQLSEVLHFYAPHVATTQNMTRNKKQQYPQCLLTWYLHLTIHPNDYSTAVYRELLDFFSQLSSASLLSCANTYQYSTDGPLDRFQSFAITNSASTKSYVQTSFSISANVCLILRSDLLGQRLSTFVICLDTVKSSV